MTNDRTGTVHDEADLHPQTVTDYSTGKLTAWQQYAKMRRQRRGTWNSDLARRQVDDRVLETAIKAAGGDSTRLWFDDDGSVWILNHTRGETCTSPACPVCTPRELPR